MVEKALDLVFISLVASVTSDSLVANYNDDFQVANDTDDSLKYIRFLNKF